mgnify:CR=1 FL=1
MARDSRERQLGGNRGQGRDLVRDRTPTPRPASSGSGLDDLDDEDVDLDELERRTPKGLERSLSSAQFRKCTRRPTSLVERDPPTHPPPPSQCHIYIAVPKSGFIHSYTNRTFGGPSLQDVKIARQAPLGDGPVCPSSLTNLGRPVMSLTSAAFQT